MNKLYKVIWNKSTQTWAAVSELASGYSRSSRSGVVLGTLGSALLLSSVLLAGFSVSPVLTQ